MTRCSVFVAWYEAKIKRKIRSFLRSSYATYSIRDSSVGMVTGIRTVRFVFESRQRTRGFFLSHTSRSALGSTLHPIARELGSFTVGKVNGSVTSAELKELPMLKINRPPFSFTLLTSFHCVGSTNLNFV